MNSRKSRREEMRHARAVLRVTAGLLAVVCLVGLFAIVQYEGGKSWQVGLAGVALTGWLIYFAVTGRTVRILPSAPGS